MKVQTYVTKDEWWCTRCLGWLPLKSELPSFRKEMVSDTERNRCRVVNRVRSTCLCISMFVINSRRNREVWYGAIIRGPSPLSLSRSGTLTHRQTDTMGTARPRSAWRARTERDRGRIVWRGEGVRGRPRQRRLETNRLPQGQGQVEEKFCY